MAKNPWHKRYHADALGGYMGLSLEERGAYTTVLDLLYSSDWAEGIPDRPRWIAGHLNCSVRKWESLRESLLDQGKIRITEDGLISNSRYEIERENALETSRAKAKNGASGGRKSGESRRKAAEISHSDEASASDLPLYARAKDVEVDVEKKDSYESPPISPEPKTDAFPRPDWAPVDVWKDFLKNRKTKRLPNTATAHKKLLADVDALVLLDWPPDRILREVTAKGWGAVYAPPSHPAARKINGNGHAQQPPRPTGYAAGLRAVARFENGDDPFG